jgi:anti-sigma regulatory factor (Ser/Thr protein kinase)
MIAEDFAGTLAEAARAEAWAVEQGARLALPEAARFALSLCLEELFVNAVTHGGAARVRLALNAETLEFRDDGAAFDPTVAPAKRLDGAGDFEIGGFGTGLLQNFARRLDYRRADGWNVVRLAFS